jgi:hypothetical protein
VIVESGIVVTSQPQKRIVKNGYTVRSGVGG